MPKQNNPEMTPENIGEKIEKKIEPSVKKAVRFLHIDEERQKKITEEIKEKSRPSLSFVLLTVFSTIIVALGLLIDSSAVVIGGMIISPMLWPILSLSIGIIKGNSLAIRKNILTLSKATLLIFLVSLMIGIFSPDLGDSREILLRTKPTLFELFIALAAGFVGTYVVAHPKLSGTLAGVAVAVALVPPLSAMGLLCAEGNFVPATGAALLYFTNLIAIALAAVILFLLVGIKFSRRETSKNLAVSNIGWFVVFLIVVAIPLTLVMRGVLQENKEKAAIRKVIESYTVNTEIAALSVEKQGETIFVQTTLQSPSELTSMHVDRLSDILTAELGSPVSLKINVIPTYEAGKGS